MLVPINQVFVSHSRSDQEGLAFLRGIFAGNASPLRLHEYPLRNPGPPHAQNIREQVRKSVSMVVLLSPELDNAHTRAWVGYEVGLAAERGIPVVVIESESGTPVMMPIPYVTFYLLRPRQLQDVTQPPWRTLGETGGAVQYPELADGSTRGGLAVNLFAGVVAGFAHDFNMGTAMRCLEPRCAAKFITYATDFLRESTCPVCRSPTARRIFGTAPARRS